MTKQASLFIVLLVLLNSVALYKLYAINKDNKELRFLMRTKDQTLDQLRNGTTKFNQDVIASLKITNSEVLPQRILSESAGSKPVLFLRVHSNNCNDCVKESIRHMEELERSGKWKVMIAANFPTEGALKGMFSFSFPCFLQTEMPQDSVQVSKAYFFTVDKNHKMQDIFYPEWDMPKIMDDYFAKLSRTTGYE